VRCNPPAGETGIRALDVSLPGRANATIRFGKQIFTQVTTCP
jgi:hypothetical protein